MTIAGVRKLHRVPAKRGMRVIVGENKASATIVGSRDGYLRVKIDATGRIEDQHASWKIAYLDEKGVVIRHCQ